MSECNIEAADPDNGTYFGMPCRPESAALVLVSAPWDATAPEGSSSSYAPDAMIEESMRMDLYDPLSPDEWRKGIATADIDYTIQEISQNLRQDVERLRAREEKGGGILFSCQDGSPFRRLGQVYHVRPQKGRGLTAGGGGGIL